MSRLILRLFVALLTFLIGLVTASMWHVFRHSGSPTLKDPESSRSEPVHVRQERRYTVIGAGKAASKDGTPASFSGFSSSDGMGFSQWSVYHSSPGEANRELRTALRKATEIIKREPLIDTKGRQVGEKVIATFPATHPHYGAAALLWTNGSMFRYVASSSLLNILEYERDSARWWS